VEIAKDLYVKSPESLASVQQHLTDVGYSIKDCSTDDDRPARSVMEQNGWSLWFAKLSDDVF